MTLAEMIYPHSLKLPEPAAREVLDFIEFLEQRYNVASEGEPAALGPIQQQALQRLSAVRIRFEGKPIADRDQLHDDARG
jgi:hypothetical protein